MENKVEQPLDTLLSKRIKQVPKSFIREILKVTNQPDVISFAGGLPNAALFPVDELAQASAKVFENNGSKALQYANTEGDFGLRNWISKRYKTIQGLNISADNILITNGSQQTFDLLGKVLLNEGDNIVIENPGYLGAIQSFSLYQPTMHPVSVDEEGMDLNQLENILQQHQAKFVYTVPNFQNPTGVSYSNENRTAIAKILSTKNSLLIQDDPYGDLRYSGKTKESFYSYLPEQTIMLGTFSKTVAPSFRLGWIVTPDVVREPLIVAKQAADLHTNYFSQQVMSQYLQDNSLDQHLDQIISFYGQQKRAMLGAIEKYFPQEVYVSKSEGGMFLWLKLPSYMSSMELLDEALKVNVAFVPGAPFYVDKAEINTLRLSYVTVSAEKIDEGIKRLAACIRKMNK